MDRNEGLDLVPADPTSVRRRFTDRLDRQVDESGHEVEGAVGVGQVQAEQVDLLELPADQCGVVVEDADDLRGLEYAAVPGDEMGDSRGEEAVPTGEELDDVLAG